MDLLNLLAGGYSNIAEICDDLGAILRIVGIVVKGIQIGVPIILIFVGMMDFAKAVTEKDDDAIKKAEKKLINRAIAAACVFFVVMIVGVLMTLIGEDEYKDCIGCITHPFGEECKVNDAD